MYIYMYTYIYIYTYLSLYTYIYIYIYIFTLGLPAAPPSEPRGGPQASKVGLRNKAHIRLMRQRNSKLIRLMNLRL